MRQATIDDAQPVRDFELAIWNDTEGVTSKWDAATFVRYGYVYVAIHKKHICGALLAIEQRGGGVYVIDLVVRQAHRREGVATRLYQALFSACPNAKIETHVSPLHDASLRLHEKLGFRKVRLEKNVYGLQRKDDPRLLLEYKMHR